MGLGAFRYVSLLDARQQAYEHRKIARAGGDPVALKRKPDVPTFAEAVETVIGIHREGWKDAGNRGLTTFAGQHVNVSLLFPMEQVFENFVAHSFGRHQRRYRVAAQHPQKKLATIAGKGVFTTKPDIALKDGKRVRFILDAKWKDIDASIEDGKHGIDQDDMYQLYAYGKLYGCEAVALVYPRTGRFASELRYRFFDGLPLVCLPFDVTQPEESVGQCLRVLGGERLKA